MSEQETRDSALKAIHCQGKCKVHRGGIYRVEVRDIRNGKCWGLWWYCQEAIDADQQSGLSVSIIDHISHPSQCFPNRKEVKP